MVQKSAFTSFFWWSEFVSPEVEAIFSIPITLIIKIATFVETFSQIT